MKLPDRFEGASAWVGANMGADWLLTLSAGEVDEVLAAARSALRSGVAARDISVADFPLGVLADRIAGLRQVLLHGIGFEVWRGLPVGELSADEAEMVFAGIGAHLGALRSQNAAGDVIGHVRDTGARADDPNVRIYQTAARQSFHTESADVVGLLCLQKAKAGGTSLLVSLQTIYNVMKQTCPELLEALFQPVATDRRGEVPEGAKPYFMIPVLNWHEGFLTGCYQRQYIESAQRFAGAPLLSAQYIEALDLFDAIANDPAVHLEMQLEEGDMQFVYNHGQLHDRTGFEDWPEATRRRHLLRLWVSLEGDRPLPEIFKERYDSIEIGNRGGVNLGRVG